MFYEIFISLINRIIIAFYFELAFPFGFNAHFTDIFFSPNVRELNYNSTIGLPLCMKMKQMELLLPLHPTGCCYEETQLSMTVLCCPEIVFWMKFGDYMQLYKGKFSMTIHVQGLTLKIKWNKTAQ